MKTYEEQPALILDKISPQSIAKKKRMRTISYISISVVTLVSLIGILLLTAHTGNAFAVEAYTLDESELLTNYGNWRGYYDGETLYVHIRLKCDSANVTSVEYFVDEGFFALPQTAETENREVREVLTGSEQLLDLRGATFDLVGSSFTLYSNSIDDDLLLLWGYKTNWYCKPEKIDVHAVATFNNGKTAEQTVTIDLVEWGMQLTFPSGAIGMPDGWQEMRDYFMSIPLEECELIPESVKIFTETEVFEYENGFGGGGVFELLPNSIYYFDENSILRGDFQYLLDDKKGSLVVVRRNNDETLTGMVYYVPLP